ncbi:MAG: sensor histidine kinase [Bacteroidia bacterium]
MKQSGRIPFSIILMGSSLVLLGGFLTYWLAGTYKTELAQLQSESHLLFLNSAQNVEDKLLRKVFVKGVVINGKGKTDQPISKFEFESGPSHFPQKLAKGDAWIQEFDSSDDLPISLEVSRDLNDKANVTVFFDDSTHAPDEIFTILSMFGDTATNDLDKLGEDQMRFFFTDTFEDDANDLLVAEFQRKLSPAQQRVGIRVIEQADSQFFLHQNNSYRFYRNPIDGRDLALDLGAYQTYILQRIFPQILFSIFLFLSIALAFYLVYRSLQQQKRLATLKNDFVSNITHELKTPITTVSVAIEALRNFQALNDPAKTEEYLDISKNELNRLSILVDRVLRMSSFEHSTPELKKESLDLQELLDNILTSFKLRFEQSDAKVNIDYHGDRFLVSADKAHLSSVLYNLIDNALKYSPERPQLDLKVWEDKEQVWLKVADQGIGIEAEYQKKVFDKFFRVPTGNKHNVKGHGLGLSYVADVIRQHDGGLHLESKMGEGTSISISLDRLA